MTLIKTLLFLPALLLSSPAIADPIASRDAAGHVGETATVKGRVSLDRMPSGEIYVDLDGQGENAPISGYISRWNRGNFQYLSGLEGKVVTISGRIAIFRDRPEIFLTDPSQIAGQ
jgi:DNA/RNA endonuclease YhcR with UshA esterase domain